MGHNKTKQLCLKWMANLWIISKLGKLHIVEQTASRFNDVLTLLRGFFNFSSQEKTASPSNLWRKANAFHL